MSSNIELFGTIIVAVISAIIGPTIVEYFKQKIRRKRDDIIKKDLKKNVIIHQELTSILEELESDRVWITQFHNGGHFLLSNKSIQKFSMTYEITKMGISPASIIFKDIPVSLYSRAMSEILNNGHIFISDFDNPKIESFCLKSAAHATNTKASYIVSLTDIVTDKCIGTVGVDFMKKTELSDEQTELLMEKSNRIAGYLSVFLNEK